MVWDDGRVDAAGNPYEAHGGFNAGTLNGVGWTDTVLFSLRPILLNGVTLFDGGEIWVWHATDQNAQFLNQGGHLWDTQFDVMATFGVASENINAIESVGIPLPPVIWLLVSGLGAMFGLRRPAA